MGGGQRDKRATEKAKAAGKAVEVIDVSEHQPRRIPSAKWHELINRGWQGTTYIPPLAGSNSAQCACSRPADYLMMKSVRMESMRLTASIMASQS